MSRRIGEQYSLHGVLIIPIFTGIIDTQTAQILPYDQVRPSIELVEETAEFRYCGVTYSLGCAYMIQGGRIGQRAIPDSLTPEMAELANQARIARLQASTGRHKVLSHTGGKGPRP